MLTHFETQIVKTIWTGVSGLTNSIKRTSTDLKDRHRTIGAI